MSKLSIQYYAVDAIRGVSYVQVEWYSEKSLSTNLELIVDSKQSVVYDIHCYFNQMISN